MHMHTLSVWRLIKSGASDQMQMHTLPHWVFSLLIKLGASDPMHMHTLSMWRLIKSGASDQMQMHTLPHWVFSLLIKLGASDPMHMHTRTVNVAADQIKWKCV